eukprot:gnl/TRDRNA2_/TRDRNA2_195802_c0_seq1.p1 gnl/TRDRNA2_/TRDRNA2_195802_c0~~gnl/TRDRNA2_/TRDRNA2_195802_c0_seq1.p1  ORF type:complete len:665 (-),score=157.65 gnl/TRDRNA2_/TRDRNA2_195802_c0_seq1:210-2204(-)
MADSYSLRRLLVALSVLVVAAAEGPTTSTTQAPARKLLRTWTTTTTTFGTTATRTEFFSTTTTRTATMTATVPEGETAEEVLTAKSTTVPAVVLEPDTNTSAAGLGVQLAQATPVAATEEEADEEEASDTVLELGEKLQEKAEKLAEGEPPAPSNGTTAVATAKVPITEEEKREVEKLSQKLADVSGEYVGKPTPAPNTTVGETEEEAVKDIGAQLAADASEAKQGEPVQVNSDAPATTTAAHPPARMLDDDDKTTTTTAKATEAATTAAPTETTAAATAAATTAAVTAAPVETTAAVVVTTAVPVETTAALEITEPAATIDATEENETLMSDDEAVEQEGEELEKAAEEAAGESNGESSAEVEEEEVAESEGSAALSVGVVMSVEIQDIEDNEQFCATLMKPEDESDPLISAFRTILVDSFKNSVSDLPAEATVTITGSTWTEDANGEKVVQEPVRRLDLHDKLKGMMDEVRNGVSARRLPEDGVGQMLENTFSIGGMSKDQADEVNAMFTTPAATQEFATSMQAKVLEAIKDNPATKEAITNIEIPGDQKLTISLEEAPAAAVGGAGGIGGAPPEEEPEWWEEWLPAIIGLALVAIFGVIACICCCCRANRARGQGFYDGDGIDDPAHSNDCCCCPRRKAPGMNGQYANPYGSQQYQMVQPY